MTGKHAESFRLQASADMISADRYTVVLRVICTGCGWKVSASAVLHVEAFKPGVTPAGATRLGRGGDLVLVWTLDGHVEPCPRCGPLEFDRMGFVGAGFSNRKARRTDAAGRDQFRVTIRARPRDR